jgi:hypothetical protein
MDEEDYRIIQVNDYTIRCFKDGRIHTTSKRRHNAGRWIERTTTPNRHGYIRLNLGGKYYNAHRLILMAFVGYSDQDVDHINRIKTDNRLENLRYCTHRENMLNRDYVDNAKGYCWHKRRNKWHAQIWIHNKLKHLGYFDKEEDARQCYLDAKARTDNI